MLGLALSDAISDGRIRQPKTLDEYLLFTDDDVMSRVREVCHQADVTDRPYAKTLVDRNLPLHLGTSDDPGRARRREEIVLRKARGIGVAPSKIMVATAESLLIKPGRFPSILAWDRALGRYDLYGFEELSHFLAQGVPPAKTVLHYYVDRTAIEG